MIGNTSKHTLAALPLNDIKDSGGLNSIAYESLNDVAFSMQCLMFLDSVFVRKQAPL